MIGNAFKSILTGAPGWETEPEQHLLAELAKQVPAGATILEIGAEFGMSTSIFAKFSPADVQVTSVDLFPNRPEYGSMLAVLRANLAELGLSGNTHQLAMDSVKAASHWDQPIALLFVDGDHSYAGVKADIAAWLPFVPVGGKVAFHDCACQTNKLPHSLHFEVTKAVSEWFQAEASQWKLVNMVDTIEVFERTALPAKTKPLLEALQEPEALVKQEPTPKPAPAHKAAAKPAKGKRSHDAD